MSRVCCLFVGSGKALRAAWDRWPDLETLSFSLRAEGLHPTEDELQTLHAGFRVRLMGVPYRLEWFTLSEL